MITTYEISPSSKPGQIKSVRVQASARKQVAFKLVDGEGRPESLNQDRIEPDTTPPDFSPQPALSDVAGVIRLRAVDGIGNSSPVFDIEGIIEDADTGYVSFVLSDTVTQFDGVYHAEVGLFADEFLIKSWPVRIIVEPTVFAPKRNAGALTIPEVRLAVLDLENNEESLLDDLEFSDDQIIAAMRRVIDVWNETPPQVMPMSYSSFPWREWWLRGSMGYLYDMAAAKYRRDRLSYSAGGMSVDDKNKEQSYQQMAELHKQEFMQWMRNVKVAYNMERCWGTGI